jgi:regulator of replication initiation timing
MSRKVVEIPVEVWEFSLQDAEHIAALHRETLRLMNENARLNAEVEELQRLLTAATFYNKKGKQP